MHAGRVKERRGQYDDEDEITEQGSRDWTFRAAVWILVQVSW